MRIEQLALILVLCLSVPGAQETSAPLTLEAALRIAIERDPELREADALRAAAEARVKSVSSLPNPEAIARMESAPLNSAAGRDAEYLAGFSQAIPLGGRLGAAKSFETANLRVAQLSADLKLLKVRRHVSGAFASALFADEALLVQSNSLQNAQATVRIARAQVERGEALREHVARAERDALTSELAFKNAQHLREHAYRVLSSALGSPGAPLPALAGSVQEVLGMHSLQSIVNELVAEESLAKGETAAAKARVRLVHKERIPDVNIELLYRRMPRSPRDGIDVGFRIPIPIGPSARHKIAEASANGLASQAREERIRRDVGLRHHELRAHLQASLESQRMLTEEIRPGANSALQAATRRYEAGDISLAELLPYRRESLEVEETYLKAMRDLIAITQQLATH